MATLAAEGRGSRSMSYARFNGVDSEVYVYRDSETGGFVCCDDEHFETPGEMLLHLLFHRVGAFAFGFWRRQPYDRVPQRALNRLAEEDNILRALAGMREARLSALEEVCRTEK